MAEARELEETDLLRTVEAAPTLVLPAGAPLAEASTAELGSPTWVLVRTTTTADSAFATVVLVDPEAGPAAELEAAIACADACYGVSASRFTASLSPGVRSGAEPGADAALARLASASGGVLPPPSLARVAFVIERARVRAPRATFVLQALHGGATFGVALSREARTGAGPLRASFGSSPRALLDAKPPDAPLEAAHVSQPSKAAIAAWCTTLEATARRPVRLGLAERDGSVRVVLIQLLRRAGLCAFALAADLVDRGAATPAEALGLIDARDVATAIPLGLEADPRALSVTGVAAGAGIAEGFVCVSMAQAAALASANLPPILFSHEIFPDEIETLKACAGVVTVRGGLTGEAAVMARGLAKPCVASGATVALAADHVKLAEGGRLDVGERVTIDGSTGRIVRGAHPRSLAALAGPAASVLHLVAASSTAAPIAAVERAAHVTTAARLGAAAVAIHRPHALLFEALLDPNPRTCLIAAVTEVFATAHGLFDRVHVTLPSAGAVLPPPVGRAITSAEAHLFEEACEIASAAATVAIAPPAPVAVPPDSVLVRRIAP